MNKKTPKKHSTLSNTLFALKWQFEIAPDYTVFTLMQTVLGDVVTLFEHTFLTAYIINCVEQKKTLTDVLYFLIPVAIAYSPPNPRPESQHQQRTNRNVLIAGSA